MTVIDVAQPQVADCDEPMLRAATASRTSRAEEDDVDRTIPEDPAAFAELVRRHERLVRTFLARLAPSSQVDDLAQEVFVAAWRRRSEFRGDSAVATWLLGIARNLARGQFRREARERRRLERRADEWSLWQLELPKRRVDGETHADELEALGQCLQQLPPASRGLIEAFYFEQESSESLSQRLEKSDGAVRMTLLRIRRALRECVDKRLRNQQER